MIVPEITHPSWDAFLLDVFPGHAPEGLEAIKRSIANALISGRHPEFNRPFRFHRIGCPYCQYPAMIFNGVKTKSGAIAAMTAFAAGDPMTVKCEKCHRLFRYRPGRLKADMPTDKD